MTPEQLIKRRERRKRKFLREIGMLVEFILAIIVAGFGEQHGVPGMVVIGFALMGIIGCRAWRYR